MENLENRPDNESPESEGSFMEDLSTTIPHFPFESEGDDESNQNKVDPLTRFRSMLSME